MAKQVEWKEEFDHKLLRVAEFLKAEFELTDAEVDYLIYDNTGFEADLEEMCGYPDYRNYN